MIFGWQEMSVPVLGYCLGSIPSALWICKVFHQVDITKIGSGNAGMTNVWRTLGWKPALPVALLDAAKGFGSAWLGVWLTGDLRWALAGGGVAVLGHSYSFLARFKGGKSVLTAFGVFLFLSPIASLISLALWMLVLFATRFVSLGSLVAAVALPIDVFLEARWHGAQALAPAFWVAVLISAFVIVRHRPNLFRLLDGTEPRFRGKST